MDYVLITLVLFGIFIFWATLKVLQKLATRKILHFAADSLSDDTVTVQSWDESKQEAYNQERIALGASPISVKKK
jgi:hypothetical protein